MGYIFRTSSRLVRPNTDPTNCGLAVGGRLSCGPIYLLFVCNVNLKGGRSFYLLPYYSLLPTSHCGDRLYIFRAVLFTTNTGRY